MLNAHHQPQDQYTPLINKWLKQRQELLVRYCNVAGVQPYQPHNPIERRLQEFCESLVDYISIGHFEMYQHLLDSNYVENSLAERLFPRIAATTQKALEFNEKYETSNDWHSLPQELSQLGVALAARFELEDKMITPPIQAA